MKQIMERSGHRKEKVVNETALLAELKARLIEVNDLGSAASVLGWDEAVFMPPAGAPARGRQKARLATLTHQKATSPDLGRLLDKLSGFATRSPAILKRLP